MAPPRARTPSGHDIPIPESVFQAIQAVQVENAGTRAEVAGLRSDVTEIKGSVAKLASVKAQTWTDLAKVLAPVALAIIGAQRALAPTPPAPEVRAVKTVLESRLEECKPLAAGSQARYECFARVYAETEGQRR